MKNKKITFKIYNIIFTLLLALTLSVVLSACSSTSKDEMKKISVNHVDIEKFMGKWYVLAGRFTFLEKEVHNSVEIYTWNKTKERIDIAFTYNKGAFDGPIKSIPQKGWIYNKSTNAHWKVSPFWPIKADFLVLALAEDYSWTAIGVPSQKYLWIMARDYSEPEKIIEKAKSHLSSIGYNTEDLTLVPHNYKNL